MLFHYAQRQTWLIDSTPHWRPHSLTGLDPHTSQFHSVVDACMADINGDGLDDYVMAAEWQGLVVWLSKGPLLYRRHILEYNIHYIKPAWAPSDLDDPHHLHGPYAAAVACMDMDNDGSQDVFVLYEPDARYLYRNAVFLNRRSTGLYFAFSIADVAGSSVAVADYDSDGLLDLLVAHPAGFDLYHNELGAAKGNHWLEVTLWGRGRSASFATGSTVQVIAGGGRLHLTQLSQPPSGSLQPYAQHHQRFHFGLGKYTVVDEIVVQWPIPYGHNPLAVIRYNSLQADQNVQIMEFNANSQNYPPTLRSHSSGFVFRSGACAVPGQQRLRPSFFIIGQFKCATSSLAVSMFVHPQIKAGAMKELHYFSRLSSHLSMDWYLQQFPCGSADQQTFDGSPSYLSHPAVPSALLSAFPDAKVIVLLRDPVERAFSHYRMDFTVAADSLPAGVVSYDSHHFHALIVGEIRTFRACIQALIGHRATLRNLTFAQLADNTRVPMSALGRLHG